MPASPIKDKNYDLVHVLQLSLEHAWRMETYIKDADRGGDTELADWFRRIQTNSQKAGDQGKELLLKRLQMEGG